MINFGRVAFYIHIVKKIPAPRNAQLSWIELSFREAINKKKTIEEVSLGGDPFPLSSF